MTNRDLEQTERNSLWQLYWKREKEFEAAKLKRSIITIIGYAVAIFLILNYSVKPSGRVMIGEFVVALFLSGILFLVNALVFTYLIRKGDAEGECLKAIRKSIDEIGKTK